MFGFLLFLLFVFDIIFFVFLISILRSVDILTDSFLDLERAFRRLNRRLKK